jgi:hypothetical protein
MDPLLNKFVSWLIVFSVMLNLIFLCFILVDISNIHADLGKIWEEFTKYHERIHNLEILALRNIGIEI